MAEENGDGGKKKKRNLSPETRERLSQLAKERHARGEFGGSKFGKMGGRPKKQRAADRVAQAAQEDPEARKIIQVFKDAIHPSQPMSIRLKAAEAWLGIEREEAKVALQEADHEAKHHDREELIGILAGKFTQGPMAALLRKQLEEQSGITDAEVVSEEVIHSEAEAPRAA